MKEWNTNSNHPLENMGVIMNAYAMSLLDDDDH